jgi:hypothetical protein
MYSTEELERSRLHHAYGVHICEVQDGSFRTYLHVDSNVRGRDSIGEISQWRMLPDMKKEVHLQDDVLWNEHSLCVRR